MECSSKNHCWILVGEWHYRLFLTALNTIINQQTEVQSTEPISTTAMKMKVRVNDKLIIATPDTGAAISIISSHLAEQLNLTVLPTPPQRIQALNSLTQVVG